MYWLGQPRLHGLVRRGGDADLRPEHVRLWGVSLREVLPSRYRLRGWLRCEGATCAAQRGDGASCEQASQCASGQCVEGVCCNTACEGACEACNLAGSVGTCSPAPSTVQCRGSGGECDVAEYCTGTGASCPADGFQASGAACSGDGNACTVDVCDGTGSCTHPLARGGVLWPGTGVRCGRPVPGRQRVLDRRGVLRGGDDQPERAVPGV